MSNPQDIKSKLSFPKDVVIISHRNPDGDAIGSSLGLKHYLLKHGHAVKVVVPSDYPDNFSWMPDIDNVLVFDNEPEEVKDAIVKSEIVFCLDFNALDRIDKVGDILMEHKKAYIAMIDHHLEPEHFADYLLSDTTASSTCELVFDFITDILNDKETIDKKIGECLFAGILTDTGSFKYSTSSKLFRIVADLLDVGVNDYLLQDLIFNSMTEKQLRLLGHALYNRMEVIDEYHTAIIALTKDDYLNFDIQRGDTEGIVNFLLKMPNIKMAAFITQQPKIIKLSLRSKGDFSVQEIASKYFKGGGHKNASGGYSYQSLPAVIEKFKQAMRENKHALIATTLS